MRENCADLPVSFFIIPRKRGEVKVRVHFRLKRKIKRRAALSRRAAGVTFPRGEDRRGRGCAGSAERRIIFPAGDQAIRASRFLRDPRKTGTKYKRDPRPPEYVRRSGSLFFEIRGRDARSPTACVNGQGRERPSRSSLRRRPLKGRKTKMPLADFGKGQGKDQYSIGKMPSRMSSKSGIRSSKGFSFSSRSGRRMGYRP